MTISKTAVRRLRIGGTAAAWLGGWAAIYVFAAWLGSGRTLSGFHTTMIAISVGLLAVWIACRAVVFGVEVRHSIGIREWEEVRERQRLHLVTADDAATAGAA